MGKKKEFCNTVVGSSGSGKNGDEGSRVWAEKFEASMQGIMSDMHSRYLRKSIMSTFSCLPHIISDLEEKESYTAKLRRLQNRFEDPEFKLAIIGNFSCGKSTFLNAMIGRELLSTSVLPTTAIPTYIRWNKREALRQANEIDIPHGADDPFIVLTARNGQKYNLTDSGRNKFMLEKGIQLPKDLGDMIDYITTTNSLIRVIEKIDISFPEKEGFENFCLIDTPGVNPGDEDNKDHIVQTQIVLHEEADAAIILYTAKDAMTKDTRQFIEENAAHLMENAIIVLTKMDLVPDKQIAKVIRSTTRLAREQFHQKNPGIYSISAWKTLEYASGRSLEKRDREWAEGFETAVNGIINQLHVRRSEIVSQRIAFMMREMIESLSLTISKETEELEKENEILQRVSASNLEKEFNQIKDKYEKHLKSGTYKRKSQAGGIVDCVIEAKKNDICNRIGNASNRRELNSCLKEYYPSEMKKANQRIINRINEEIIPEINAFNKEYISQVEKCLEKYNRNLGRINGRAVSVKSGIITNTALGTAPSVASFVDSYAEFIAATGIKLMIPGVNLLVFAAGWFLDTLRFDSQKDEAKVGIEKSIKEYKSNLLSACQDSIQQTQGQNIIWAEKLLDEYKGKYRTSFEKIEEDYEKRSAEVEKKIKRNRDHIMIITKLNDELSINRDIDSP